MIAERWNFPEQLVVAIRFHHDPAAAPRAHRNLVETVYLANMFCEYESRNVSFDQFDTEILEDFGINSKKQFESLLEHFAEGFNRESR
jgi:HD-like signal output (HDOD) protein